MTFNGVMTVILRYLTEFGSQFVVVDVGFCVLKCLFTYLLRVPTTSKWLKFDPFCLQYQCSTENLVYGNI